MDPCLGIMGPKMGPMFKDFFCQKPTHLGGTSPYSVFYGSTPSGLHRSYAHRFQILGKISIYSLVLVKISAFKTQIFKIYVP